MPAVNGDCSRPYFTGIDNSLLCYIFQLSCHKYSFVSLNCIIYGLLLLTLQDTEGIAHIINASGVSCVLCSPEMLPKLTASKQHCPSLKLLVQLNSWPYDPCEEGRRHMEALKSFLLLLQESNKLSPNRGIDVTPNRGIDVTQDTSNLVEHITKFVQKVAVDSGPLQETLFTIFKHHIALSQDAGLLQQFVTATPGHAKISDLTVCHVNTMLVLSCVYHCFVMGCIPQPISISKFNDLVAVVYTSGSTGLAKGVYIGMYAYI